MPYLNIFTTHFPTVLSTAGSEKKDPLQKYNVTWNSPSADSSGSMLISNGDIGLNVWVEPNDDLLFYIGKTDAWSENGRLLKLGRLWIKLSPNPFVNDAPFRQEPQLRLGQIVIVASLEI